MYFMTKTFIFSNGNFLVGGGNFSVLKREFPVALYVCLSH